MKQTDSTRYKIKIPVWEAQVPFNSDLCKLDRMNIDFNMPASLAMLRFFLSLKGQKLPVNSRAVDTFTYLAEIKPGFSRETYNDIPYLAPFLVPGSDKAVIIVPGGGFGYKSVDYEKNAHEGSIMAASLNKAGISAFVLWYRSNPYRMPAAALDLQRAIRYLRFYAEKFAINPKKIGVVGFSAGGFLTAYLVNVLRNKPVQAEGYQTDAIDREDSTPALAAHIYPALTLKNNLGMLCAMYNEDSFRDAETRNILLQDTDLARMVKPVDPPQFLALGTRDMLIQPDDVRRYQRALDLNSIPNVLLELDRANHAFPGQKYQYWRQEFTKWANQVFDLQ